MKGSPFNVGPLYDSARFGRMMPFPTRMHPDDQCGVQHAQTSADYRIARDMHMDAHGCSLSMRREQNSQRIGIVASLDLVQCADMPASGCGRMTNSSVCTTHCVVAETRGGYTRVYLQRSQQGTTVHAACTDVCKHEQEEAAALTRTCS